MTVTRARYRRRTSPQCESGIRAETAVTVGRSVACIVSDALPCALAAEDMIAR
jgi:hypothetical protein